MDFRMSDVPVSDVKVAEAVVQCLQKCGGAFDDLLVETKDMMPESDRRLLRRGVGQIMGNHLYDLWTAIVDKHPQFKAPAFGE
jgi:hypothetical protein